METRVEFRYLAPTKTCSWVGWAATIYLVHLADEQEGREGFDGYGPTTLEALRSAKEKVKRAFAESLALLDQVEAGVSEGQQQKKESKSA